MLAGIALGCGGENEAAPSAATAASPAASATAPSATSEPTDPTRLEALYEWDATAGQARDLAADTRGCMSQVTATGLPGVAEHIQCMRNLGWKTVRPQG
jgi:hypothetical protein